MKRLVIILLIQFGVSYAQDTLPATPFFAQNTSTVIQFGDRKTNIYYWDTNWYDQYERIHPGDTFYPGNIINYCLNQLPGDLYFGRACVAETPIMVKGIAGAMAIRQRTGSNVTITVDTTILGRVPEQFSMYDGTYNLLAEGVLYSSDIPKYKMEFRRKYWRDTFDVYEVYFDKPVLVSGQFYVGGTTHNNLLYGYHPDYGYNSWDHLNTLYPFYSQMAIPPSTYTHTPYPQVLLYKYNSPYNRSHPEYPDGGNTVIHDTLFDNINPFYYFLPFFAIIDTEYVYIDCQQSINVNVTYADLDSVVVSWENSAALQWDVMVWTEGMDPDSGMMFSVQSNQLTLYGLDVEQNYNIKVKAVCDTFHINTSAWSDVFLFRVSDYIVWPCLVPEGLRWDSTGMDGCMIVEWEPTDAGLYDLAVWGDSDDESGATIIQCQMEQVMVEGLDTAQWYNAKVRAVCDSSNVSEWSDTIRFFVPNLNPIGDDTTAIDDVVSRHIYLVLNPTSDKATVFSSYQLQKIELFNSAGVRIEELDADALSMEIDLSSYPTGVYMIRITTTAGVTTKRMVRQ